MNVKGRKKQLSLEDRKIIEQLIGRNYSHRRISVELGVGPSTVSTEIRRNSIDGVYDAEKANQLYLKRLMEGDFKRSKRLKIYHIQNANKSNLTLIALDNKIESLKMQVEILSDTLKQLAKEIKR